MGVLSGLGAAAPSIRDPYFPLGKHRVQLVEVKLYTSNKDNSTKWIIRAKVLETSSALPIGTVAAQIITITGNKSAMGNIKAFLAACVDYDTSDASKMSEIDEKFAMDAINERLLIGFVLDLVCTNTKTGKGDDFTVHTWSLAKDAKPAA